MYDKETLAAFGYTPEALLKGRAERQAEYAKSLLYAKMRRSHKPCPCNVRMCIYKNVSVPNGMCSECGTVAYSGPPSAAERMCMDCGYRCAKCVALHPDHMVPEEWMFLTCAPCSARHGSTSSK
jgi:hypothetical protein